ncbi:MAG: CBS domain-containing protein [Gammaproteobacteria bacterium]
MNSENIVRTGDVMSQRFIMQDGLATVAEAIKSLRQANAECVIVKKRHDDDEYGIVLLSDIARKIIASDRSPERVNLYEVMSKPVISVRPSMDIRYTARMFETFGLSMAPVLKAGDVLGVVSYREIVLLNVVSGDE